MVPPVPAPPPPACPRGVVAGATAERVGSLQNDVDAPSPAPSERPSVPSVTSLEHGGSGGSAASVLRGACGPLPGPAGPLGPLGPPPLEPRA